VAEEETKGEADISVKNGMTSSDHREQKSKKTPEHGSPDPACGGTVVNQSLDNKPNMTAVSYVNKIADSKPDKEAHSPTRE
jgi:hypothetical protein